MENYKILIILLVWFAIYQHAYLYLNVNSIVYFKIDQPTSDILLHIMVYGKNKIFAFLMYVCVELCFLYFVEIIILNM